MGTTASINEDCGLVLATSGVLSRRVTLPGNPLLMVGYPARKTMFVYFSGSDAVETISKMRIRSGIRFRGHHAGVTGIAVLAADVERVHVSEDTSAMNPFETLADPVTSADELLITVSLDGALRIFEITSQACAYSVAYGTPLLGLAHWPPTHIPRAELRQLSLCPGTAFICVAGRNGAVWALTLSFQTGILSLMPCQSAGSLPAFDSFGESLTKVYTSAAKSNDSGGASVTFLVAVPCGFYLYALRISSAGLLLSGSRFASSLAFVCSKQLPQLRSALTGASFITPFSDDRVAVCGFDRVMVLDRHMDWSPVWCGTGHTSMVTCMSVSNDGRRFATGDLEGYVRIWESVSASAHSIEVLRNHHDPVLSILWAMDDRMLLSTASHKPYLVSSLPLPDSRHIIEHVIEPDVLPRSVVCWLIAPYLAPTDIVRGH